MHLSSGVLTFVVFLNMESRDLKTNNDILKNIILI